MALVAFGRSAIVDSVGASVESVDPEDVLVELELPQAMMLVSAMVSMLANKNCFIIPP